MIASGIFSSFDAPWLWRELNPFYSFETITFNFKTGIQFLLCDFNVLLPDFVHLAYCPRALGVLQKFILCSALDISDELYFCLLDERELCNLALDSRVS